MFATVVKSDNENAPMPADSITISEEQPLVSDESPEEAVVVIQLSYKSRAGKVKSGQMHGTTHSGISLRHQ